MKKIEMYEANDGRVFKSQVEAERVDIELRLKNLVNSIVETDWCREKMESVFAYLILSDDNLWRITRELCRIRKIDRRLKKDDIPF